uniref:Uncharacterized protein n=1 Tax=Anguilla anguilla TaxID=7936 RepID=A0A0E9T6L0_ANGAN
MVYSNRSVFCLFQRSVGRTKTRAVLPLHLKTGNIRTTDCRRGLNIRLCSTKC